MNIYQQWIKQNVIDAYGKCAEITLEMQQQFPELKRVRGHYYCFIWGEREHWWLTNNEEIIDPTASQFPSKGKGAYIEFKGFEPTGKCLNCGNYVYNGGTYCSQKCHVEYRYSYDFI